MSVFATALRGRGHDASVIISVEMNATKLGLTTAGTSAAGQVEVAAVAINAGGKVAGGQRERFTLALKSESWTRAQRGGMRVLTGMTLPPGRYQLRVAAGNTATPDAGSVMYDLDVPDYSKGSLAMSPPILSSERAPDAFTYASPSRMSPTLSRLPIATRDFAAGERLSIYTEVYANKSKEGTAVDLLAELRRPDGSRIGAPLTETRRNGNAVQKFDPALALNLPPGAYILHIEASSSAARNARVSRDIPIRVH
jgi:hypothetical protein